jgi:hypothetical protein
MPYRATMGLGGVVGASGAAGATGTGFATGGVTTTGGVGGTGINGAAGGVGDIVGSALGAFGRSQAVSASDAPSTSAPADVIADRSATRVFPQNGQVASLTRTWR